MGTGRLSGLVNVTGVAGLNASGCADSLLWPFVDSFALKADSTLCCPFLITEPACISMLATELTKLEVIVEVEFMTPSEVLL